MERLSKNTKLLILYIISSILLEMIFFVLIGFGVFPKYFWFDLCAILIIVAIIYLSQNYIFQSILFWIFLSLQLLICVANIIINKAASDLFSIDMLFLSKEGLQAFEPSFIDFRRTTIIFVVFIFILFAYIKISKTIEVSYVYKRKNIVLIALFSLLFTIIGLSGYSLQSRLLSDNSTRSDFYVFESDKYLYENLTSKTDAYRKFGTFGFYVRNVSNYLSKDNLTEEEKWDTVEYLLEGKQEKSQYSGISKGNNVMTILLETMEYYAIDPYFTPNLYNIFFENENTLKLNNFYANNRTNISEGLTLFGNYDKEYPVNTASDEVLEVFDKQVKFTLPALLKEKGYSTTYYHDYCSWYYNRNITHPSAGFDEVVGLEKMNLLEKWVDFETDNKNPFYEWKNWTLDSDVMNMYFDKMTNSENGVHSGNNFFTHFSLITMHGNHQQREQLRAYYDTITEDFVSKYGNYDNMMQFINNMGYSILEGNEDILEYFLWYKAAAMDVDKMVGILLDKLASTHTDEYDEDGKQLSLLDTTTIVFFADHNCYYNGMAYYMRGLEYTGETINSNLYKIPCAIFDTKLANVYSMNNNTLSVDKFTSTYNLLPTILDVLGVEYNPNFYYGDSIFSDEINVFQSNISGSPYFTDKFLLANNIIEWQDAQTTADEELDFKQGALDTFNRISYISKIYRYPEILDMYLSKLSNKC